MREDVLRHGMRGWKKTAGCPILAHSDCALRCPHYVIVLLEQAAHGCRCLQNLIGIGTVHQFKVIRTPAGFVSASDTSQLYD